MRTTACFWLLGSMAIINLQSLPSNAAILVFFVVSLFLTIFVPRSRPFVFGLLLSATTLGMAFFQLATHQLNVSQVSTDLSVSVEVTGIPRQQGRRLAFDAQVMSCHSCVKPLHARKLQLSWYGGFPEIRAGQRWQLTVRLKPPTTLRNTGGFDAIAWSLVKGIHARGYVRDADTARRLPDSTGFSLSALRQSAADRMTVLAGDSSQAGVLQALTVGVKTHITDEQWTLLRDTGTAHLMAISGLHVGLVAGWVLLFGKRLGVVASQTIHVMTTGRATLDTRPWVLSGALLAAFAYAGLAGFELPTQRAVLMLGVWMLAALRFRFLPPMTALAVALALVLAINSLSLLSAGFWLSFGTVAALFYLHGGHQKPSPEPDARRWKQWLTKLGSVGRTHVLLGIVLLPVTAWFFQTGSLVAPLANLIAVPWVALVCVPMSLLALLLSYLSQSAGTVLLIMADSSLQALLGFLHVLNLSALSSVVITLPGIMAFVLVIAGLLLFCAPRGLRLRFLAAPLFLPALLYNSAFSNVADGFEVHVLDVGQGLAVLVFAGEETLLFDTGGKISPDLSLFEAVVVPFLQASGRRTVDTLVVSHGDEDHAFGVADVVRRYPDVQLFSSAVKKLRKIHPVTVCDAGFQWTHEGVQFAFVHPSEEDKGSDNNRSCVLMVYQGESRVLLTGDIEAPAERRLLSRLGELKMFPVTLMTAPHHGSISSSTQAFVDKTRPEYVVFPAGHRNRYGFPHTDVILRYKLVGSKTFTTGNSGAVSFVFGSTGLSAPPTSWWKSRRRFWHGIVNPDCWQHVAGRSLARRLLALSQKGQSLCGK